MKRILVVYFSQSGQLKNVLQSLVKPLIEAGHQIHFEEINAVEKYPFPWSAFEFFNAFPETFMQKPMALKPFSAASSGDFDLIILGYQPWFLTPSRPISSFLQTDEGKRMLKGKPVITILGCRNMWLGAQEKVKQRLKEANAKLIGHIALIDKNGNLTSLVTILRWMLAGKKEPFWIFPAAGVSASDVEHAEAFGRSIGKAIENGEFSSLQDQFLHEGAIEIKPDLVLMERRGQKSFSIWSKFVAAGGDVQSTGRKVRVYVFMYLVPTVIIILTPLLWVVSAIMRTVKRKQIEEEIAYFKQTTLRDSAKTV